MTQNSIKIPILAILLIFSACTYAPGLDKTRNIGVTGNPFYDSLREGYIDLADNEWSRKRYKKAKIFINKANMIAKGDLPKPEGLKSKKIIFERISDLREARDFVNKVINMQVQHKSPLAVANLQLMYDCWVLEEDGAKDEAKINNSCRKIFDAQSIKIKAFIDKDIKDNTPSPIPTPPAKDISGNKIGALLGKYSINFALNSSEINAEAEKTLLMVIVDATRLKPSKILIKGNTDRSGSLEYNKILANNRATKIANFLQKHGISSSLMDIRSYGASSAWVDRDPKEKNQAYRSVEVVFVYDDNIYYK